jgi:hypothetical protein
MVPNGDGDDDDDDDDDDNNLFSASNRCRLLPLLLRIVTEAASPRPRLAL